MKWKVRVILDVEQTYEAENARAAIAMMRAHIVKDLPYRFLGAIPADEQWPDQVGGQSGLPPRGGPPSGTPGTPTARLEDQPVDQIAKAV